MLPRNKVATASRRAVLKSSTAVGIAAFLAVRGDERVGAVPLTQSAVPTGSLAVAQGADAQTLDAGMTEGTVTANVNSNIYDTLVIRDDGMLLQPGLAESWENVDETTWRFTLREGVNFHNGEPLTAEAVKFSLERVSDPEQAAPQASYLSTISGVNVVDEATVEIVTKAPDPILLARLVKTVASIVPPGYVTEQGDEFVATHPVGTGPFKFVEWVRDDHITLEANENYWRGAPKIETLQFIPIPEASTRTAALQTGEVDIIVNVPVPQAEAIANGPDTKVIAVDVTSGEYLGFSTLTSEPLQDKRVRQALNYALNVPAIIENVLGGYATRAASPVTPFDFGWVEIEPYPYDPEQAKQLLAEAGFGDGLSLTFDTPDGRYPMDRQVSEVIAGQLAEVGVATDLRVREWGTYMDSWAAGEVADLYLLGWGSITTLDADAALYDELHCDMPYSTYCNPALDEMLETARTLMDEAERAALYAEIQQLVHEEAPWAFLYHEKTIYGLRQRVNWQGRPDVILNMYGASVEE